MPRVLLIDDDEQLGPPLATYFQRFGLTLEQATRPSAGLARLREGGFDAAILDVMLPEMDGFELCRTIRKESALPIVMLTARGDVMDRVVGLELGADDYLPKPFESRELLARLQTVWLNKKDGNRHFTRGIIFEESSEWRVTTTFSQSSGNLFEMSRANCLVMLNEEKKNPAKGEKVECILI